MCVLGMTVARRTLDEISNRNFTPSTRRSLFPLHFLFHYAPREPIAAERVTRVYMTAVKHAPRMSRGTVNTRTGELFERWLAADDVGVNTRRIEIDGRRVATA